MTAETETILELLFTSDGLLDDNSSYIRVPATELVGKAAISVSDLANWAFYNTPAEFPVERQKLEAAFCEMERQQELPNLLWVLGPEGGDYYVQVPVKKVAHEKE